MRLLYLLMLILPLSGCDFWFDNFNKKSEVALFVSSTPRTELEAVEININKIELQHSAGQWHPLPLNQELRGRNLQNITSATPLQIAQQDTLPKGEYTKIRVHFIPPAGLAHNRKTNGRFDVFTANEITVDIEPRLRLQEDKQSQLLLAFDFQQALAYYEDDYEWYYRLEHQGLHATPRDSQYFYGDINESAWQSLGCNAQDWTENNERIGSYVYLYRDSNQNIDALSDVIINNTNAPVATAVAVAKNSDAQQSQYRFSPMPSGHYILALTCHGDNDHPLAHNPDVLVTRGKKVQLTEGSNFRLNF